MRSALLIVIAVFLAGCGGFRPSSERAVYKTAREAVRNHSGLPDDAVLYPRSKTELYVGKSAARVDLPYDFVNESGETITGSYTVWLSYLHHSWQVDQCFPTPKHSDRNN